MAGEALGVELVEVRRTEVLVGNVVREDMPHGHQGAMCHRHRGLLGAAAAGHPGVETRQVGIAGAGGGPSRLNQGAAKPLVALTCLPRPAFASSLVVAGAEAGPGGEVC